MKIVITGNHNQLKDINGNIVKVGDVLLREKGGGSGGGMRSFRSFTLWEMPTRYDGHGYHYSLDGSKHLFAWAWVNDSIKLSINELPKKFVFSFYHGMGDFHSYSKGDSVSEILGDSNWKERCIEKNDVLVFSKLLKLKLSSIDDVRKNIDLFVLARYIPKKIVLDVICLAGGSPARVVNGELGIATLEDTLIFHSIIYGMRERN